jgi:hypothetical protein
MWRDEYCGFTRGSVGRMARAAAIFDLDRASPRGVATVGVVT